MARPHPGAKPKLEGKMSDIIKRVMTQVLVEYKFHFITSKSQNVTSTFF